MPDPIANAVAAELKRRGLSIRSLAKLAGTSQPVISRWLAGDRSIRLDTLEAALDQLEMELHVKRKKPTSRT